jgi:hypothetical protein
LDGDEPATGSKSARQRLGHVQGFPFGDLHFACEFDPFGFQNNGRNMRRDSAGGKFPLTAEP